MTSAPIPTFREWLSEHADPALAPALWVQMTTPAQESLAVRHLDDLPPNKRSSLRDIAAWSVRELGELAADFDEEMELLVGSYYADVASQLPAWSPGGRAVDAGYWMESGEHPYVLSGFCSLAEMPSGQRIETFHLAERDAVALSGLLTRSHAKLVQMRPALSTRLTQLSSTPLITSGPGPLPSPSVVGDAFIELGDQLRLFEQLFPAQKGA